MQIIIMCSEFQEDERALIAKRIENTMLQLKEQFGLNFDTLAEVIVPDIFDDELIAFQTEKDMSERGRTSDRAGIAIAKVLKYKEGERLCQTLFLSKDAWLGMFFSEDKSERDKAVNILHHELAHVQENQYSSEIFGEYFDTAFTRSLHKVLQLISMICWQEYYADRMSGFTMPLEHAAEISSCIEVIDYAVEELGEQIALYRNHGDIGSLWEAGVGLCNRIMSSIGSFLGSLHWAKTYFPKDEEEFQNAEIQIGETLGPFEKVWKNSSKSLAQLFSTFPKWSGPEDLDNLAEVALQVFYLLGLHPRQGDKGIFVEVPYT